jgi:hypothetical protein
MQGRWSKGLGQPLDLDGTILVPVILMPQLTAFVDDKAIKNLQAINFHVLITFQHDLFKHKVRQCVLSSTVEGVNHHKHR